MIFKQKNSKKAMYLAKNALRHDNAQGMIQFMQHPRQADF